MNGKKVESEAKSSGPPVGAALFVKIAEDFLG